MRKTENQRNHQIRRPSAVTGLCLVGLGLAALSMSPSSSASVSDGATTDGAIKRRLQQVAVDPTSVASSLASHIKDPDLLDGDNPGW